MRLSLPVLGKTALAALAIALAAVLLQSYATPLMTLALDITSFCF